MGAQKSSATEAATAAGDGAGKVSASTSTSTSASAPAAPAAAAPKIEKEEWQVYVDLAKRRERSDFSLEDWRQYGFATSRAKEFERLAAAGDEPAGAIPRVKASELSLEEFWEKYEKPGRPCVIEGVPKEEGWGAWERWPGDQLCSRFADVSFKVGKADDGQAIKLRMEFFAKYMKSQADDSPLYLFDNRFGGQREVRDQLLKEYKVPSYFPDDYMALAGEDGRPPYRWISVGPRRSGTVMHQDPLCTSAWNTLLSGRKRWVLLDPETPRAVAKAKHVMAKDDDDEAVNVFLDLLPRLRAQGVKTVEFVQYPGDTIFLPGRWWHCVLNVDDTVAVTQNFAGRHNFDLIWRSARSERPCWSHKWLLAMDKQLPALAARARGLNTQDGFDMQVLQEKNRQRRKRRRERRELRELRKARRSSPGSFDEAAWRRKRLADPPSSSDSDSTVSTSSSSSSSDASSSGASSAAPAPAR